MTYDEFCSFLLRYLWRDGDTELTADLHALIKMGESRLTRDLKIQRIEQTSAVLNLTSNALAAPLDFKAVRSLFRMDTAEPFSYVPLFEIARQRTAGRSGTAPVYSVSNGQLLFASDASALFPLELGLIYQGKVPDFRTTDASWLTDEEFLDLYVYAVLMHTGGYLRQDPRVSMWTAQYNEALASVLSDDVSSRYSSGQLTMPMPEGSA